MEYIVKRDNNTDLAFKGERLAEVTTCATNGCKYDDYAEDGTTLRLYKTYAGNFICETLVGNRNTGRFYYQAGAVCATPAEVMTFFGLDKLAKDLYRAAGIQAAEQVS